MAIPAPILLAEDEQTVLVMLSLCLRDHGFAVIGAENGEEALTLALQDSPRLVITDYQMPRRNGLELAKALRADPRTSTVPVIMLTARGHKLLPSELAETNVRHVLPKPFSARVVLGLVKDVLHEEATQDTRRSEGRAA